MKSERAASRYSKALLDLALEQNSLDQVKDDALVVLDAVKNSRELRNLLASPVVKPEQKGKILAEIFNKHISDLSAKFIALVVKQGRDAILSTVFESFITKYRAHKNIMQATFETSSEVPAATLALLKQKLEQSTGKTLEIATKVNPALIGGYVIDMENYRLDASLAGGMRKLKRELSK